MTFPLDAPPVASLELTRLRDELEQLGFTQFGVGRLLGMRAGDGAMSYIFGAAFPVLRLDPERETPLELLGRLFLAGNSVDLASLKRCFSPAAWSALVEARLVVDDGGQARATVILLPWKGIWLACDRREHRYHPDFVFFPDRSTLIASEAIPPLPGETTELAVDVGSGSGVCALLARRAGFRRVRAIDVSARALAFTAFNAALNGLDVDVAAAAEREDGAAGEGWAQSVRDVDLLTFTMPQVYSAPIGEAVAAHARGGDRLLTDTYAAVARVLAPVGRAVLYHQILTQPGRGLDAVLAAAGASDLHVAWRPTPGSCSEALEYGVALVRRRRPGEPAVTRVILAPNKVVLDRAYTEKYVADLRALDVPEELDARVPFSVDNELQGLFEIKGGKVENTHRIRINGFTMSAHHLPLIKACDGKLTVAALAAAGQNAAETRRAVRMLVESGVLVLHTR